MTARRAWQAAAVLLFAALFVAATSRHFYHVTLPPLLLERLFGDTANDGLFSARTAVRKFYSLIAFALMGFVVTRALPPARRPLLRAALVVAAFSFCIEVAQTLRHAREGLGVHAFDVACGGIGGWLGAALDRAVTARRG